VLLAIALSAGVCAAQDPVKKPIEPSVGQPGKDVVWVPTSHSLVQKMLDIAGVTAQDEVIDLGSGDGRTVIAAAKRGARARGIEYNPEMVELSIANARAEGVSDKATFVKADLFETDLSKATVITMFLLTDINLRLRPTLLTLKPGTRLVSNTFTMGEWEADATASAGEDCTSWCTALLWIVPARVEGTWTLADLSTLTLSQSFQMVSGTLAKGTATTAIESGRLRGDEIRFAVGSSEYTGRVNGDSITGSVKTGDKTTHWSATRRVQ
jgi:SAM-dependent methyltransferase